jgi:hypothetical protein
MNVIEFTNSSAVAKVSIDSVESQVGVAFTYSPEKYYMFRCDNVDGFVESLNKTVSAEESVGKFISQLRKEGALTSV